MHAGRLWPDGFFGKEHETTNTQTHTHNETLPEPLTIAHTLTQQITSGAPQNCAHTNTMKHFRSPSQLRTH